MNERTNEHVELSQLRESKSISDEFSQFDKKKCITGERTNTSKKDVYESEGVREIKCLAFFWDCNLSGGDCS